MQSAGVKSTCTRWLLLTVVAIFSVGASCDPAERREYEIEQLIGTWRGITLEGEAELIFSIEDGVALYKLKAMPGSFPERPIGQDLLSQGTWLLNQSIIILYDDQILAYYTCLVSDRFDISLNSAGTIMTMTHFGTECVERGQIMEYALWYKQTEGE